MKKISTLSLFVLSLTLPCAAQQKTTVPAWELFGGYSFERTEVREYFKSSPILYSFRSQREDLNGWDASLTENLNSWFGGTLDISGQYTTATLLGTTNQERRYAVMYGPRFSLRTPWVIPFADVLLGVARGSVAVTPVGPHASELGFAMSVGAGLDINLAGKAAIRLVKGEYFRANILGTKPNSFRASAGVVFYFGDKK